MKLFTELLHLVYPPVCLVCRRSLGPNLSASPRCDMLCVNCEPETMRDTFLAAASRGTAELENQNRALLSFSCEVCGEPTTSWNTSPLIGDNRRRCVACYLWPPPVRRLRSLWRYSAQVKEIIKALKYGGARLLSHYIADRLAAAVENGALFASDRTWDVIIPIPSSTDTLRHRGFSQMSLIGKALGRFIDTPLDLTALRPSRLRPPQTTLPLDERHGNVEGAFSARERQVAGKTILLLDDVMTTGASIFAAAGTLLQAKARSIDVLTVARANEFQAYRLLPANTQSPNTGSPVRQVENL